MKRMFAVALVLLLTGISGHASQSEKQNQSSAKATATAEAKTQSEVQTESGSVTLEAGSQINADMSSSLDLKRAKPGDGFKMKTTRPVKRNGKEIISRGSTITGHVEQVARAGKTNESNARLRSA